MSCTDVYFEQNSQQFYVRIIPDWIVLDETFFPHGIQLARGFPVRDPLFAREYVDESFLKAKSYANAVDPIIMEWLSIMRSKPVEQRVWINEQNGRLELNISSGLISTGINGLAPYALPATYVAVKRELIRFLNMAADDIDSVEI